MIFDKVKPEHILLGIKDFEEKGFPKEFGPSTTFDLVYEGKKYPAKTIMAYANYHASGRKIERYFKGGKDTECFDVLKQNGFNIEPKSAINMISDVREEFAKWLLKNAPDSYNHYLGSTVKSVIERLNEIQNFFPEVDFFNVDEVSYTNLIESILNKLNKKERIKKPEFIAYDKFHSSGIPKAILGKNNYLKFLEDKYTLNNQPENLSNQKLYDLKISFLKEWPIERLKTMTLEEYTNLDKTSFCYWIEAITTDVGSIWGGSAYKFGIFKRKDLESDKYNDNRMSDGEYAWYGKYGNSKEEVFEKIRNLIVNIATFSQQNNLIEIDNIDLGDGYKWKIAFLYGDYNIINIFKLDALKKSAKFLGYDGKEKSFSALNKFIIPKKGDRDYFDFSKELWKYGFDQNKDNNDSLEEEQDFINRIKNSNPKSINTFFSVLDKLIVDLEIQDAENLVFSTGSNQLSFQIGKRYCLNLKKDTFDFIAPENHLIEGVERSLFAEPDIASYYKNASSNAVIENYKAIAEAVEFEIERDNHTFPKEYDNNVFRKTVFDKNYRASFFDFETLDFNNSEKTTNMSTNLNQIFFGPPGTGKTYHTINEAIKIADPEFYAANEKNRDKLKERFKLLLINADKEGNGQIAFTTFHQSFSYEDFVEGIKPLKPKTEDTFLKYDIQEGIFKDICDRAENSLKATNVDSKEFISLSNEEFDKSHFYKMSLGNSQTDEGKVVFDYCAKNDYITLGFGDYLDFTGKDEKELKDFGTEKNLKPYDIQALNYFKNYLKAGNYVIISYGNGYIRAIGKVVGEYEFKEESPFVDYPSYNHFRKVEWIFNDKLIEINEVYHKNLSQQTIYKLDKNEIKKEFFVKEKKVDHLKLPKNPKNFVLIIDEINRGNVSSIFGELITLIEKDKRTGGTEELSVILPYSKKEFKVPQNVFIIGTMNTADRSIEALDTALRRRFSFREMPPKSYLISDESKLSGKNGIIGTIDVVKILDTINDRIEKLIDKDHKIGHSYFMDIETESDLQQAFKNKVIPLLEEYFFGDFGKIGLILGKSFITKTGKEDIEFAEFDEYDSSIRNDLMERSVFEITDEDTWDFENIYTKSI